MNPEETREGVERELPVTVEAVERRVAIVSGEAHDPESAHGAEDALYMDVLRAIAAGAEHPELLAAAALRADALDFPRWYA